MNWEAIGAIGEIVSATAVLISLIYLAVQIRQNTRQIVNSIDATRLAAFEQSSESGNRLREFYLTHPELLELYLNGCRDYASLTRLEKIQFAYMVRNGFSTTQAAYIRELSLGHDPNSSAGLARVVDELIASPGVREYLHSRELDWRPEFKKFVAERIKLISEADSA